MGGGGEGWSNEGWVRLFSAIGLSNWWDLWGLLLSTEFRWNQNVTIYFSGVYQGSDLARTKIFCSPVLLNSWLYSKDCDPEKLRLGLLAGLNYEPLRSNLSQTELLESFSIRRQTALSPSFAHASIVTHFQHPHSWEAHVPLNGIKF